MIDNDKTELPKSRAKPDREINHVPNAESQWRVSTLKSLIQGYSTQVITCHETTAHGVTRLESVVLGVEPYTLP